MIELFAGYSVAQIIVFIIVILLALKEMVSIFEFFHSRTKGHFSQEFEEEQEAEDMKEDIKALYEGLEEANKKFDDINKSLLDIKQSCQMNFDSQSKILNKLIESDRDDIRGFIVKEYHYFVEQKHWIDDFSMDVLEKRFAHYVAEGGNSYIESLMNELRNLPKHPTEDTIE